MNRELEEGLNNGYLVRRRLSNLRKEPGRAYYILDVEKFRVLMYTNADFSIPQNKELKSLVDYKAVSVEVWENIDSNRRAEIDLWNDYRFEDIWRELKWTDNEYEWKFAVRVPLHVVCDLIKHIDRINQLLPFH